MSSSAFWLDGRQIDLDRFDQEVNRDKVPTFENRVAVLRSILERIPVPTGTGEINAILPAIVAGDTFVRDVKTTVRPLGRGMGSAFFFRNFSWKYIG